jgi:CheY-like chemotaxis protein
LHLALKTEDGQAYLVLKYQLAAEATSAAVIDLTVLQLVSRLNWHLKHEDTLHGTRKVILFTAADEPVVLVIDDNEGLLRLVERFLQGQACRVIATRHGQEGLRLAQELVPDVVILDVMMPEMDGWELLQRLRTHPRTAGIPVIVCSVIKDPNLARSLGASLFLPKPVSREEIMTGLRRLGLL